MNAIAHDDLDPTDSLATDSSRPLGYYVDVLRRRRALLLTVFLLTALAATAVALMLPAVYRSTATILIKEQEIPQELVRSTVTSYADERIQVISQQVMTRATLLALVDQYGLYGKARQRETSEEILDRMRRDIKLTPISAEVTDRRTGSPVRSTIAFTLSFDSEVAGNAQKIANELTTLFLNENVKNRQQKAAETTSFLEEELARVSEHISDVEQRLARFKRRNQGSTPDLSLSNQVNSERLGGELQRLERETAFLQERRMQLETQLVETRPFSPVTGATGVVEPEDRLRMLETQLAGLTGVYSEDHPDIRRLRREIASLRKDTELSARGADREDQLQRLRTQLAQLRQKYSDDHPDVVRLRRSYAAVEEAVRQGDRDAAGDVRRPRKADNPAYLALKAQIDTTAAQIDSLRAERGELQERLRQLDVRLAQTPEVEREYLELTRDLDSSRARFRELRDKQMQAQVAEQLERGRKAERFSLIEPPVYPERPYRPNRQLILMLGLVLAAGAGLAAVALRETVDATVHGPKDLTRMMQVPVLSLLPPLPAPVTAARRGTLLKLALLAAAGVAVIAVLLLHNFVMPVDVAWYALLRRLAL